MADNTWTNGNSTGIWSDDANWSLAHKPAATEDIIFDATSVANCDLDENPAAINSLTIAATYTGNISQSVATAVIEGAIVQSGGTVTIPSGKVFDYRTSYSLNAGGTVDITGTMQGEVAYNPIWILGTWTAHDGIELINLDFAIGITCNISDIFKDCSDANELTNTVFAYPATGIITFDVDMNLKHLYATYGDLIFGAGRTLKLANGGLIEIRENGTLDVDGTRASPVTFECYTVGGTWGFEIWGDTSSDIQYLICNDLSSWWLGDETDGFYFARTPRSVTPPKNLPHFDQDEILGRDRDRLHFRGGQAAIVEIEGIWDLDDGDYEHVDTMLNKRSTVGLVADKENGGVYLTNARIIDHDYQRITGTNYAPYVITLIEDL